MSASDGLKLRAHHALCIRFFQGKGYSAEFTAHMQKVVSRLEHADPAVALLTECDTLCAHCPHRRGTACRSAEKVRSFDQAVLSLCGLHADEPLRWPEVSALVDAQILRPGRLGEVCGDCEWFPLCSSTPPLR